MIFLLWLLIQYIITFGISAIQFINNIYLQKYHAVKKTPKNGGTQAKISRSYPEIYSKFQQVYEVSSSIPLSFNNIYTKTNLFLILTFVIFQQFTLFPCDRDL